MFRDKIYKNKILVKYIMASYPPPSEILPHFNPSVFDTEDVALSLADANKLYAKKSGAIFYGGISAPSLSLAGVSVGSKLTEIDANSNKLRKIINIDGQPTITTDYAGNYIYKNNALQFFNTAEGYFNVTSTSGNISGNYVYQ